MAMPRARDPRHRWDAVCRALLDRDPTVRLRERRSTVLPTVRVSLVAERFATRARPSGFCVPDVIQPVIVIHSLRPMGLSSARAVAPALGRARTRSTICFRACLGVLLADEGKVGMGANMRPRGRVLVVDDDPIVCELVATTLGEHGYPTRRASDVREALYLVERETPDVVVLDVRLPDISGYQLCRRLRDDYGDSIGIILLSGERMESLDRAAG